MKMLKSPLKEQIDEITNDFNSKFANLTKDEWNWKPDSSVWSIAQNIDHLIVINSSYFPLISAIRKGSYQLPFVAKFGFIVNFFGKTILKAVQPDRRRKMKTFTIWEPTKSEIEDDILARFETHQSELKKIIEESTDLINRGAVISSPANKLIVYKLNTAFDIIVTHERRHLEQAKELLELMPK
ncbi:MAG: DinB family protein [Candidatus Kapabacteria bacterium]|nr:DinB family protein [Candidatus Kapabacteria bacterium]